MALHASQQHGETTTTTSSSSAVGHEEPAPVVVVHETKQPRIQVKNPAELIDKLNSSDTTMEEKESKELDMSSTGDGANKTMGKSYLKF